MTEQLLDHPTSAPASSIAVAALWREMWHAPRFRSNKIQSALLGAPSNSSTSRSTTSWITSGPSRMKRGRSGSLEESAPGGALGTGVVVAGKGAGSRKVPR